MLMSVLARLSLALFSLAALPLSAHAVVRGEVSPGGFGQSVTLDFEPDTPPLMDSFQQDFTSGEPPVVTFSRSAEGIVDGDYGTFSAYALAELNGIPPTAPSYYGVSSDVDIYAIDRFRVESEVLEDGTEVELAFEMDVVGNGRVSARMDVDRMEGATLFNELNLSYSASGGGSVSDFSTGSITALVGKRYQIEYSVDISISLTPSGLSEENPTKFVVSDYEARFYVSPVSQPAVTLAATSGHDYTPVPEASSASGALVVLGVLARRLRRRDMPCRSKPTAS